MTPDQGTPGTGHPAEAGAAPQPMGFRQALREIRKGIVVMWWSFFDWLAVISWKALLLVSFLGLVLAGMLQHPLPVFFLIVDAILHYGVNTVLGF